MLAELLNTVIQNFDVWPLVTWVGKVAGALVFVFVGLRLSPVFVGWLSDYFDRKEFDESFERFILSLATSIYKVFIIVLAISFVGVETASIVAAFGAAGFAVGLALQGSMSNFASGILILAFKPIAVGDVIELQGEVGVVVKIEIFSTTLKTRTNAAVIIPNSDITGGVVINYSAFEHRVIEIPVGIAYESSVDTAKEVLHAVIQKDDRVLAEPESTVAVENLGAYSVDLLCRVSCKPEDFAVLQRDLLEEFKKELEAAGIEIPYPKQVVMK